MSLSATAATLGVSLASAAGSVDPTGIARWAAIAQKLAEWLPANITIPSATLAGAGGTISGTASLVIASSDLGDELAEAAFSGLADAAGLAAWQAIGSAIIAHITSYALANGAGMTYVAGTSPPPFVPVAGTGTISFSNSGLGQSLATAAGSVDAAGRAAWVNIGTAILSWMTTNAIFSPTTSGAPSLVVPPPGGAVVGTGELI